MIRETGLGFTAYFSCVVAAVFSFLLDFSWGELCLAIRPLHRPFADAGGKLSLVFVIIYLLQFMITKYKILTQNLLVCFVTRHLLLDYSFDLNLSLYGRIAPSQIFGP